MLIVSLDQYIVVVALPDIGRALGYTAHTLQLVVSAYAVASSGFLLVGGRAADLLGQRRMLATGLVLYTVASLAGGLATGPAAQLAARVVQGLGGALVFPATLAVVTTTYAEGPERNRALGIWGAAGAAGLVVGVLLGGVLTRYLGWSSVFFINVPLAVGALVLTFVVVPQDPPRDRTRRFDLAGALTAMAAVTLVVWSLVQGPQLGWTAAGVLGPAALGLALGWVFTRIERRAHDPLMPRVLVRSPFVRLALVLSFLFMATFGSLLYFVSIYLQNVLRYDALQTGLGFLAPTTVVLAASALAGAVPPGSACARRVWPRSPSVHPAPLSSPPTSPPPPATSGSCRDFSWSASATGRCSRRSSLPPLPASHRAGRESPPRSSPPDRG